MKKHEHAIQAKCPFCGECQSYDEATPSKPLLSEPYQRYDKGQFKTVRDTYWHQHCRSCSERIVWSMSLYPVAGKASWVKP